MENGRFVGGVVPVPVGGNFFFVAAIVVFFVLIVSLYNLNCTLN